MTKEHRLGRWCTVVAALAGFVALVVLHVLRQAGHPPWHTVFAEDGPVFHLGTTRWSDVVDPYAGYMVIAARTIGFGGHAVPLDQLARYYAVVGAVVTAACGLAVWQFAARFVPSHWLRAVLTASVVLLPTVAYEQLGNGVNTLWVILFTGWWALIDRPRTWKGAIPAAIAAAIAATATGLAGLYLPFVLLLAWKRRSEPYRAVAIAYAIGLAAQVVAVLSTTQTAATRPALGELPKIVAVRLFGSALIGEQSLATAWDWFGVGFAVAATVVVLAILGWLALRSTGEGRMLGVASVGYGIAFYVAALYGRGTVIGEIGERYVPNSTRYQSIAIWLLLSGLVLLAAASTFSPRPRQVLTGAIVVWFAVVAIVGFRVVTPRSNPTELWVTSIENARATCRSGEARAAIVVVVPTTFDFELRCEEVLAH